MLLKRSQGMAIANFDRDFILDLVNFAGFRVKQINFSCTSNDLAVILNFRSSRGSVAT